MTATQHWCTFIDVRVCQIHGGMQGEGGEQTESRERGGKSKEYVCLCETEGKRMKCKLECNSVRSERGPRQGEGSEGRWGGGGDGWRRNTNHFPFTGRGQKNWERSSHQCNAEFHYTFSPPPIESVKEYGEDFCPQTKAAGDSQKKRWEYRMK